jgi:hypothetical protein
MTAEQTELVAVLLEARKLLALPKNDYAWSSWRDFEHASTEIDDHVEKIKNGNYSTLFTVEGLFAATGPIQEVSVSSGWGQPFLDLSNRFDQALIGLQKTI